MKRIKCIALFMVAIGLNLTTAQGADLTVYSFPMQADTKLVSSKQVAQVVSQEYWFDVSSSTLNKGVPLNNTAPGALVLISQKHGAEKSELLDVKRLSLLTLEGTPIRSKKVSESELAQTGIFAKSVALQAQEGKHTTGLMLKSSQPLMKGGSYRVMVKEPHSPYSLRLKSAGQSLSAKAKNVVNASLTFDQVNLSKGQMVNTHYQAKLNGPDGSVLPVTLDQKDEQVNFVIENTDKALAPRHGLYEMQVTATTRVNGVNLQRNAKIALAISQPTAHLQDVALLAVKHPMARVDVMINTPGRYEIRAVLYATDKLGNLVPAMETHAAKDANAGLERITVPFNQKLLSASGLQAPYDVRHVRLFDQGQLALIDEQDDGVNADLVSYKNGR